MIGAMTGKDACHDFFNQVLALRQRPVRLPHTFALFTLSCALYDSCQSAKFMLSEGRKRPTSLFVVCSAISAFSDRSFCSSSLSLVLAVKWTACSILVSLAMPCKFSLKAAIDANCRTDHCHCHTVRTFMLFHHAENLSIEA